MAFQSVPNCAEISVIYTSDGQTIQNTFHAELDGYDAADLTTLADAIDTVIGTDWLPLLGSVVDYVQTEARGLEFENDNLAIDTNSAGSGGVGTACLPLNVTLAIKRSSNFTGRSARGRIFWPRLLVADLISANANGVTSTFVTNSVAAVNTVRSAIQTAGWLPVIVSRFSGGSQRPFGVSFAWTSTSVTDIIVDSQRGRLPS